MLNKNSILFALFCLLLVSLFDFPFGADKWDAIVFYDLIKSAVISFLSVSVVGFIWNKLSALRSSTQDSTEFKKFFKGIKLSIIGVVAFYLVLVSILTWVMFLFRSQEEFFFDLATAMIISWIVMVIVYYIWAIYFYNVNMGWDEEDWENLKKLKDDEKELPEDEPTKNPHAGETLGLPPGTVRGTIAVSLLVAGLAMLIASFQLDQTYDSNSLFVDNFEFLKTAFLMMIAFYFGNKSIKALGERNQGVYRPDQTIGSPSTQAAGYDGGEDSTTPTGGLPQIVPPTSASETQELKEALQETGSETEDDGNTDDFNEKGAVG